MAAGDNRLQIRRRRGINVPHYRLISAQKQNDAFARLIDFDFGVKSFVFFAYINTFHLVARLIGAVCINLTVRFNVLQPAQRRPGRFRLFQILAVFQPADGIVQNFFRAGSGPAVVQMKQRINLIGVDHLRHLVPPLLQQFAQTEIFWPEGGIGTQHFLHDSFGTVAVCRLRQIFPFHRQHQKRTGKHPHF